MVITSECLFLIYFVSFRQSHKVDDKRKYLKVVKVKDVSRGKSLIDSRWVKLKYKTGILDRYYARIVVKGYLRKNGFDLLSPLTFSHITVWLDLEINAIFGVHNTFALLRKTTEITRSILIVQIISEDKCPRKYVKNTCILHVKILILRISILKLNSKITLIIVT